MAQGSAIRAAFAGIGFHLLAGLILVVPALMNHAPLVYSDSGTYITTSRSLLPPIDRPIGYALIMRAVTWQSTLWTMIFFQGMVASWLIQRTIVTLFPGLQGNWRVHVSTLAVLLAISSLPWYASQLMPDVFSGLLALCVFLLLFGRRLGRVELALLWTMLFFFAITHYSHLVMLLLVGAGSLVAFGRRLAKRWKIPGRRAVLTGLIIAPVLGILFAMGYNARHGHGFKLSPTSSLFLAGKLIESGVMHTYLSKRCDERPYFLCAHLDELNTTGMRYVWDEKAPTRQGLGMVESSARLDPLVRDILTDPAMWPMLAWTSALATAIQFTQIDIGSGIHAYGTHSAPWWPISHEYKHELPMYMDSIQQRDSWGFAFLNVVHMWLMLAACAIVVVRWPSRRSARWWGFVALMTAFALANAAATGALANVYDRLQSRVTWLLIFAALMLLARAQAPVRRMLSFTPRGR